jgi:hypothetical protein
MYENRKTSHKNVIGRLKAASETLVYAIANGERQG